MPFDAEARKLSVEEWLEYRARCARHRALHPDYDAEWRRPTASAAEKVWQLLSPHGLDLKTLTLPFAKGAEPDERAELELTAKQALVVVLDCALRAGRRGGQVTYNMLFDALAEKWSDHYRRAQQASGASQVRDMHLETAKASRRDLLRNGVLLDEQWEIATGAWSRTATCQNPLYWLTRLPARGYRLDVNANSLELVEFERLVREDPSYRAPERGWRLLLADDPLPLHGPRPEICAERAYNVVWNGPESERLFALQSKTRLIFQAKVFEDDYQRYRRNATKIRDCLWERFKVDSDAPRTSVTRGGRYFASEREQQLWGVEPRLRPGVKCLLSAYDKAKRHLDAFRALHDQLQQLPRIQAASDSITIKTSMYRVKNRRYQTTHFWPSSVSARPDADATPSDDEEVNNEAVTLSTSQRARWFAWVSTTDHWREYLTGVDIAGSQTQILVALLGLDGLSVATFAKQGFNQLLAEYAWRLHTEGTITLNDGYKGAADPKLKALIKNLWMRVLYGSRVEQVIMDQSKDHHTYGPGWMILDEVVSEEYRSAMKTAWRQCTPVLGNGTRTQDPRRKCVEAVKRAREKYGQQYAQALKRAAASAQNFLMAVPDYDRVNTFLEACKRLAEVAVERDPYAGVVLVDPFDGAEVRWNPVKRADVELPSNGPKLILSLPGTKTRRNPPQRDGKPYANDYPVNLRKLKQMIAPCLVHMLDAYFSSLVMKRLAESEVRDFIGIHDCWLIPSGTWRNTDDGRLVDQLGLLEAIIEDAAVEWFHGLGCVYDNLIEYLGSDSNYGAFVRTAKDTWKTRKQAGCRPHFGSAQSLPFSVTRSL
jgi:hypothetical protein